WSSRQAGRPATTLTPVSSAGTRVFVARLAGTSVFDPIGDQVGRVRDVVVLIRPKGAPRAVGLVVEVPGRRRVFLPLTRVTSIDAGQVISTGLVNMRRFEQRAMETLAVSELLERTVELVDGSGSATIEDLAIERQRTGDWLVTKLYVRRRAQHKGTLGLRRRGDTLLVDVDAVTGLAGSSEAQGAADVLEAMQPDDAADLLHELPEAQAAQLLELMEPEDARDVRRLLAYAEDTAGGLMTSDPVVLGPETTIATALAQIRRKDLAPALASVVFVARPPLETPTGRFLGVAHFQRLLREPPHAGVGSVLG